MSEDNDSVGFSYTPSITYQTRSARRPTKSVSGLGVASIVLGSAACVVCWIPYTGILSIPVLAIGLLFAIIGISVSIVGQKSKAGMAIAGFVVCSIGIVISVCCTAVWAVLIDHRGIHRHPIQPVQSEWETAAPPVKEKIDMVALLDEKIAAARDTLNNAETAEWKEGGPANCSSATQDAKIIAQDELNRLLEARKYEQANATANP